MSYLEKAVEISTQLENYEGDNWTDLINLCGEADQRITELEAENKRLKDVQNSLCEIIEQYEHEYGVFEADGFSELEAENRQLRKSNEALASNNNILKLGFDEIAEKNKRLKEAHKTIISELEGITLDEIISYPSETLDRIEDADAVASQAVRTLPESERE